MQLQKPNIYNGSCGQIGNLHKRTKYPKTTSRQFFLPREGIHNHQEIWYNEEPIQPGVERQIIQFHKEFSLRQEILSLNWINSVKTSIIKKREFLMEYTVSDPLQSKNQHHQVP